MRFGIMQPYPFPYIGYFELMARVDAWIVFDVVQYNRRSWMNRNRILHPMHGWQYFSLPVSHVPLGTSLTEVRLADRKVAEGRLLGQIEHYRRHAPGHARVTDMIRDAFARAPSGELVALNVASLAVTAERLGIPFVPQRCSELRLPLEDISHPGQWALRICTELGATEYLNPPGGQALFTPAEWKEAGIGLMFTSMSDFRYACRPYTFHEKLSILDVLMWCTPEEVAHYLRRTDREPNVDGL